MTRKPAHQAEVFKASTFASRRADAAARGDLTPRPRALVSLGVQSMRMPGPRSIDPDRVVNVEYLYDAHRPARRYRRPVPFGMLEPLDHRANDPRPEPLGIMTDRGDIRSIFCAEATPDPEPVRIT
jgi:hypothetical protein